jgi:DNA-binding NtrC family response regulator
LREFRQHDAIRGAENINPIQVEHALGIQPHQEQEVFSQMQSEVGGDSQTVLVVDDYEAVLAMVSDFLQAQGFSVLAATNGSEANHIAESHEGEIDLLLIEEQLPDASGVAVSEQLKVQRPRMAVIVMSATLNEAGYQKRIAKLQAHFLWKPFTNGELLYKLNEVIGQRKKGMAGSL